MTRPRIVTIVGARPQFIKSGPVSLAFDEAGIDEIMVHTGQHYDEKMSDVFFQQMKLRQPRYNLQIGSGGHGYQTGEALKGIEAILIEENPDAVLVYGDTNATLSGALAAAKLHIPVAHVEAGIRSYNRAMPEEVNRVLTDHVSTWLFIPTQSATENLAKEGITHGVHYVGDVMLDAVQLFSVATQSTQQETLARFQLESGQFILLTMHRAENTAEPEKVRAVLQTLDAFGLPVLFPVHPRIRPMVDIWQPFQHIRCVEPISYTEMLACEQHAQTIVTDSGGVQKEAAFFQVPCITLREQTEWIETVSTGWNQLAGLDTQKLKTAYANQSKPAPILHLYGSGQARTQIANHLKSALTQGAVYEDSRLCV